MRVLCHPVLLAAALWLLPSCGNGQPPVWVAPSSSPQKPDDARPARNSAFDGSKALLAAGRNETEGLIVRAREGGEVSVSDLTTQDGASIRSDAVEIFELALAAGGHLDAVVPRQQVTLAAGGAALVRVHVPADARPGLYRGTLGVGEAALPLELTVWGHVLPTSVTFSAR